MNFSRQLCFFTLYTLRFIAKISFCRLDRCLPSLTSPPPIFLGQIVLEKM